MPQPPGGPSPPERSSAGRPSGQRPRRRRRPPGAPRTRSALVAALVTLLLVAAAATGTVVVDTAASVPGARIEAERFLAQDVTPQGQVLRPDQGDDTVSEGQAYGLLLAEVAGKPAEVRRIWGWTQHHLQRPDGLLAWHADRAGHVLDPMPASDADVLAAWALARSGQPPLVRQARRMAGAVLAHETVSRGRVLRLAAGPWATGSPATLDPSYWAPVAFATLARLSGDRRWIALERSARADAITLTSGGSRLPPDWARLDGTAVSPTPAPNGSTPQVQYGLDAQRLVVWFATSCDPTERALAARWWRLLRVTGHLGLIALTPGGLPLSSARNPLSYVAAAAAARAAGDTATSAQLMAAARTLQTQHPTYYGGAWLALGEALLNGSSLGGCGAEGGPS
ncbi:MAG TPA: glycosyl hydrolase family 8 [Solirubrobacteraceae bacterium]|nr:glycosyl hydrolase family 8 [Solirubrobacteraceae bacterium]